MTSNAEARDESVWSRCNRTHIHVLALILIAIACYSNTFHVPFILDDEGSIQLHEPVHGLANFFKDGTGYNYLPNRAFGYLTFALNYEFGGLNLPGYHAINLVIHLLTGLLVYSLVRMTLRTPYLEDANIASDCRRMFAFVVALLFVCHPIQTQAVTYIVQRFTSMTTMLYLAAFVCYLRWRQPGPLGKPTSPVKAIVWYLLSLLCTLLAMKTKEISFTLPLMILLYECSFFGLPGRKLFVKLIPLLLTLVIIPLTTFIHVAPVIESAGSGSFFSDIHTPAFNNIPLTRWEYLCTQFSVIATYLRLMFFPVNQHLDYDYPISRSLLEPRPLLSLVLILALLLLALYMFMKSSQQEGRGNIPPNSFTSCMLRLAAFGIIWFFVTLSIESSIIVIRDVIYEHRLYLPSFGFFLSLTAFGALGLQWLDSRHEQLKKPFLAIFACVVLALSVATYYRNNVWCDWITLWSDNVAKAPNKPRPHNILGIGYYYRMEYDKALVHLKEAARLKPDYVEPYFNMGLVYKGKKDHEKAIIMFARVLKLSASPFPRAYNEIGISYAESGYPDQALEAFASAVKYEPDSVEYRNNYAFALSTAGNVKEARRQYEATLKLDPENAYATQSLQELNNSDNGKGGR